MRRKDRQISDREAILRVMEGCDVCRVAFHGENYPYVVPMNFGMKAEGEDITLYFHCAQSGEKLERMDKDPRVAFEMDRGHRLVTEEESMNCTMAYECVMGQGRLERVPEGEKRAALELLMAHYHQEDFPIPEAVIPHTTVLRLRVERLTGKACRK